jgi:hypothetical protein
MKVAPADGDNIVWLTSAKLACDCASILTCFWACQVGVHPIMHDWAAGAKKGLEGMDRLG